MEIWKDIKDFEKLYQVSSLGRIKSLARLYSPKEQILKIKKTYRGYYVCQLWKNKKAHWKTVHRLVAQVFIENPENKPQVNHKDGNQNNNYASNLEWCTQSENMKHAYKMGLQISKKGSDSPASKLKENDISEIRNLKGKMRHKDIANKYNISLSHVNYLLSGKGWEHLECQY